ncbi:MAG TPA: DUF3011 domain-containing protein [Thermoanaerobaculia bacterium]|nr:DUF3011 domain-containing protein [Thermoanaerobaculia bacterium]
MSAQNALRCESTNGRRQECRFEGTPTVQLSQQLSRDECIKGETWGVERNVVWVDRGCRADFVLAASNNRDRDTWTNRDRRRRQNHTVTVVCESKDGRRHRCATDTIGEITLARQLSRKNSCVENRGWGYDDKGIWVDRGCRAEFLITEERAAYGDRVLVCESDDSRRTYCRADARFGVSLTREISRNSCVIDRTWGSDDRGVWVSNGCRAEFALKTRL